VYAYESNRYITGIGGTVLSIHLSSLPTCFKYKIVRQSVIILVPERYDIGGHKSVFFYFFIVIFKVLTKVFRNRLENGAKTPVSG
jgi:hypothetical protein